MSSRVSTSMINNEMIETTSLLTEIWATGKDKVTESTLSRTIYISPTFLTKILSDLVEKEYLKIEKKKNRIYYLITTKGYREITTQFENLRKEISADKLTEAHIKSLIEIIQEKINEEKLQVKKKSNIRNRIEKEIKIRKKVHVENVDITQYFSKVNFNVDTIDEWEDFEKQFWGNGD